MQKLKLLVSSVFFVITSFSHQTMGMDDSLTTAKTTSRSFLSSLQNIGGNAAGWMRESALNRCEQFGKWIASYGNNFPSAYFAKSLVEVDYVNDELFWLGHFNHEINDINEKPYLGLKQQKQLEDLQEIVWNGLLSPYTYEKALQKLEKKSLFSKAGKIIYAFQSALKENPEIILQHLRRDLLRSLEGMINEGQKGEQALLETCAKKLTYYRTLINAFDYAETIAYFRHQMELNKENIALSEMQYKSFIESLTAALDKTNKEQYLQIKSERKSKQSHKDDVHSLPSAKAEDVDVFSEFLEEDISNRDFFFHTVSFVKGAGNLVQQGISFTLKNPLQTITMGLALQAAAVAATTSFSSRQQSSNSKELLGPRIIDLSSLNSTQGAIVKGYEPQGYSGFSVSSAGDFNGDGVSDIIVGAPEAIPRGRTGKGISYVIYGQKGGYQAPIDLDSLSPAQGVVINGYYTGSSVSLAGDFNGDGVSDIIIGAGRSTLRPRFSAGISYVVYGKKGGYQAPIELDSLSSAEGVIIYGARDNDRFGTSVSLAGDFNGDGVSDVIVGAPGARPKGRSNEGISYVLYGKKGGYQAPIDLAYLNPTNGTIIYGAKTQDTSGTSVSSAGDFNGDGVNDVIVGAPGASPLNRKMAGTSYVVYGKKSGYNAPIDLASLSPAQGAIIYGAAANDFIGSPVNSAGDCNGDGVEDIILGSPNASPLGRLEAGAIYVIYGKKGGYNAPIDLAYLNPDQGSIIYGARENDSSGESVSSTGDFNGDGVSDIIAGAPGATLQDRDQVGISYVLYGQKGGYPAHIDLAHLDAIPGAVIYGATQYDGAGQSVSSTGDFNADGASDIVVGAPNAHAGRGFSYVVYGKKVVLKK